MPVCLLLLQTIYGHCSGSGPVAPPVCCCCCLCNSTASAKDTADRICYLHDCEGLGCCAAHVVLAALLAQLLHRRRLAEDDRLHPEPDLLLRLIENLLSLEIPEPDALLLQSVHMSCVALTIRDDHVILYLCGHFALSCAKVRHLKLVC